MKDCPCCGYPIVRCFRQHQTVSFCRHCWQEMPDLTEVITDQHAYSLLKRRSLKQMIQPVAQPVAQPVIAS